MIDISVGCTIATAPQYILPLTECIQPWPDREYLLSSLLTSSVTLSLSACPDYTKRAAAAAASHCKATTSILHLTSTPPPAYLPAATQRIYTTHHWLQINTENIISNFIKAILPRWKQSSYSQFQTL